MSKGKKRKRKKASRRPSVKSLDSKAEILAGEIEAIRKKSLENENTLRQKILQKTEAEGQLTNLLKRKFSEEKALLSRLKTVSAKKQARLRKKILSLERINQIYDEKKARILKAKRRHAALKRQLKLLEKQVGV